MHFYRSLGGFTVNVDLHWDLVNLIQRGSPLDGIYPINDFPWFEHRDLILLEGVPVHCLSPVSYTHLDVYKRQVAKFLVG